MNIFQHDNGILINPESCKVKRGDEPNDEAGKVKFYYFLIRLKTAFVTQLSENSRRLNIPALKGLSFESTNSRPSKDNQHLEIFIQNNDSAPQLNSNSVQNLISLLCRKSNLAFESTETQHLFIITRSSPGDKGKFKS